MWGLGQHYLVLKQRNNYIFEVSLQVKDFKIFTFYANLINDRRKTWKKNIESLNLTHKKIIIVFDVKNLFHC